MMTVKHKNGELYKVVDFFDVWGNEEDGWEVNESVDTCHSVFVTNDWNTKDIFNSLVELGFLGKRAVLDENVFIVNTGNGWDIEGVAGKPLYALTPYGPDFT